MEINVKGSASQLVDPDYMTCRISLFGVSAEKEFAEASVLSNYDRVKEFFESNGITESLRTSSYVISEEYEKVSKKFADENPNYKPKFLAFHITQILVIDIPMDIKLVMNFINNVAKVKEVQISVEYYIKDKTEAQTAVMLEAFEKAREKAVALAKTVKPYINAETVIPTMVSYVIQDYNYRSNFRGSNLDGAYFGASLADKVADSIEPQKISITEEVITKWEV